ncbi:MAG: hypothetical protein NVSMB60_34780 [Mycobacterium sp.]
MQTPAFPPRTTAPDVILTACNSDHVLAAVRDNDADLGFVESPGVPRGVRTRVVAHDELVVIVPAGHKWARRSAPITAAELNRTPLVTREVGSGTREFLSAALKEALGTKEEQAPPVLELSTAAAARAAVLAGAGPAVISKLAVEDDFVVGRLCAVAVADLDLHRTLRTVWVGARTPPAGAVRDLLGHIARANRTDHTGRSAR